VLQCIGGITCGAAGLSWLHPLTLLTMASTTSGDALLLGIGMITTYNTPDHHLCHHHLA
jgi:hypothetical protein